MVTMRWETDTRYYVCHLQQDLLGDWVLFQCWGSRFNNLGNHTTKLAGSYEKAKTMLTQVNKLRLKRGYNLVKKGAIAF